MELGLFGILGRILLGAGIGFCIVLTGIGGGVLTIPAVTLILGLPASVAVGTASLYSSLTKTYATYAHYRQRHIDMTLAWLCLAGAIPSNLITSIFINRTLADYAGDAAGYASFQRGLTYVIAGVMCLAVGLMLVNLRNQGRMAKRGSAEPVNATVQTVEWRGGKRLAGVGIGAIMGVIVGATSIGAGVILVPLLILVFAIPAVRTVGTSIFITLVLTLLTAIVYGKGGEIDIRTALLMSLGSIAGVFIGGRVGKRLREESLQIVVATLILVATGLMIFR